MQNKISHTFSLLIVLVCMRFW
uniref:Uncharacterized protein n=1 Tax=Arundo donax TaxID=35708 RepID=A0A0A9AGC1_ARUDO